MSLLTNDQIIELSELAINKLPHLTLFDTFYDWNKQQIPSTQFEPDWDNAPSNAKSVFLHAVWFDNEMNQVERTVISGWGRPVTPHPHAAMIMKYAEVAQRRVDPWVEFQVYSYPFSCWVTLEAPTFFDSAQRYRHIGDDK